MLDQESLRPVILSMAIYIIISIIVPRIAKKPTHHPRYQLHSRGILVKYFPPQQVF